MLRLDQIKPGRYQPRERITEASLEELKTSIKQHGVIEPVIVRPVAHGIYELVAGERRWRAAQAIGLQEIPAIIKPLDDQKTLEISLVENLQRENLNPVEEAKGYQRLMGEFHYTQEQLAETVGKERSTIANSLRLLKLSQPALQALREGRISAGHAKVLLGIEPDVKQVAVCEQAIAGGWSVRQLEQAAVEWKPRAPKQRREPDPQIKTIENGLRRVFGTKVSVLHRTKGGRVVIEYYSAEDLTRILQAVGLSSER